MVRQEYWSEQGGLRSHRAGRAVRVTRGRNRAHA
jgi:hypothetical protein